MLVAFEDYVESDGENAKRVVRLLELADSLIESKHTIEKITWFDIYESVSAYSRRVDKFDCESETVSEDISVLYNRFDSDLSTTTHNKEFKDKVLRLTEIIQSEGATELEKMDPFPDLDDEGEHSQLAFSLGSDSGFQLGAVEIPNNVSRMKLSQVFTDASEGLIDGDYKWVVSSLREWVSLYARAEATVADRNLSYEELREFMIEEETPSERYWD